MRGERFLYNVGVVCRFYVDVRFGGGYAVAQPPSLAERDIVSQTTFKTTLEVPAACREGDHVIFTLMNDDAQDGVVHHRHEKNKKKYY